MPEVFESDFARLETAASIEVPAAANPKDEDDEDDEDEKAAPENPLKTFDNLPLSKFTPFYRKGFPCVGQITKVGKVGLALAAPSLRGTAAE